MLVSLMSASVRSGNHLPSQPFTSPIRNENNSSPSASCTDIVHADHASSSKVLVLNFNSFATVSACSRAASTSLYLAHRQRKQTSANRHVRSAPEICVVQRAI